MCNALRDQRMCKDAAQAWASWEQGHCLTLQWSSRGSALYDVSRMDSPEVRHRGGKLHSAGGHEMPLLTCSCSRVRPHTQRSPLLDQQPAGRCQLLA